MDVYLTGLKRSKGCISLQIKCSDLRLAVCNITRKSFAFYKKVDENSFVRNTNSYFVTALAMESWVSPDIFRRGTDSSDGRTKI